jgi:deoxyribodipyrimidine photo-lyase
MISNHLNLPLIVFFGLTDDYPEANERHYAFMLEGLSHVGEDLEHLGIKFVMRRTSPGTGALELSRDAAITICDVGYLKHQRSWRDIVLRNARCRVEQVETDVIVPVEIAYHKEAYSAAILRPKIKARLMENLMVPDEVFPERDSTGLNIESLDHTEPERILGGMDIDRSVKRVSGLKGGSGEANVRLDTFLGEKIDRYSIDRNDPNQRIQSDLAPYLHFGQISPLFVALKTLDRGSVGTDSFLEELIIRRELSINFTYYNENYDSFDCLPEWARDSLLKHASDGREFHYSVEELENAETHDPYWNTAQKEMIGTGKMHNYMRMYWGKKILEWSKTPKEAYNTALYLNNRYNLDGRDPNSYAGVAWCFGKHDRPWTERPIFGKVRYMNDRGLERKFDMERYVREYGGI